MSSSSSECTCPSIEIKNYLDLVNTILTSIVFLIITGKFCFKKLFSPSSESNEDKSDLEMQHYKEKLTKKGFDVVINKPIDYSAPINT